MDRAQQVETAGHALWAGKALGLGAIFSAGVLGACVIAAVDPPSTRREMFTRALAAGVGSLFFGPAIVRLLDHWAVWVDLNTASSMEVVEYAAPVYLVIGCLSWGVFGALATLSKILKARGGNALADKIPGLTTTTTTTQGGPDAQ